MSQQAAEAPNELVLPGLVCFNLFFIETCVSAFHNRDVGSTPVRLNNSCEHHHDVVL